MVDRREGIHAEVKSARKAEGYRGPGPGPVSGLQGDVLPDARRLVLQTNHH